jgi:hypothetical protein
MTGNAVIASTFPLCHLSVALGFSRSSRLGFGAKIYPFLGFESHLEFLTETGYPDDVMPRALWHTPREPSLRICAPLAHCG